MFFLCFIFFYLRAEAVLLRFARFAKQHDEPNEANDGNQADPIPLPSLAYVVQTAPYYGKSREQQCQRDAVVENARQQDGNEVARRHGPFVDAGQHDANDE